MATENNQLTSYLLDYFNAVGISAATSKNGLSLMKKIIENDPLRINKFEVSFKVREDRIERNLRFLNIDSDAYSCRGKELFLSRLKLYRDLMYKKINNPRSPEIFSALREVSKTPVDLYFGADINNRAYLFAFWLIFGGIKRNGEVSFWPYESKEIIKHILSKIGFKFPEFIDADILNFGLDINDRNIYYKLYYLYKKKEHGEFYYSGLISKLDKGLKNNDYFYFFSKMYDKEGRCKKIKLFIEFLSDINFFGTKFGKILKKVLEINKSRVKPNQLIEIFKLIKRGRISLIGFEPDKTITFYIRFD